MSVTRNCTTFACNAASLKNNETYSRHRHVTEFETGRTSCDTLARECALTLSMRPLRITVRCGDEEMMRLTHSLSEWTE